jgi:hypothetical protein
MFRATALTLCARLHSQPLMLFLASRCRACIRSRSFFSSLRTSLNVSRYRAHALRALAFAAAH